MPSVIALIVIVVLVVLLGLYLMVTYNGLVSLRNRIEYAWAQIDVQLKRRYDLIPNLVETVKGYAAHERETLDAVITARNAGMNAGTPQEQAAAENQITGALKSIFALSEAYPELKANQNFLQLQEELTGTEGRIAYARQFYNDTVLRLNTKIQSFPTNVPAPNAFATGRDPRNAAVAVTTGLLERMNRIELEGVLAHELSHVKNYDILVSTLAVTLVGVVVLLADWGMRVLWWSGPSRR